MREEIKSTLAELLRSAEDMSSDIGATVEEILREGLENPLSPDEVRVLLTRVVEAVRRGAARRGDQGTVELLDREAEALIGRVEEVRARLSAGAEANGLGGDVPSQDGTRETSGSDDSRLRLEAYDGIRPRPVQPTPVFHERPVAVREGFVRTQEIELWDRNERLDIHLNQFQQKYGRGPNSEELMAIMKGEMPLPGIEETDQFAIRALAKSIAVNGVRKPPIIDVDGKLLDGNRRVTACYHILEDNSGDFTPEEKQRAKWLKVWQLTEHATDQDREAVIVSLNFEPDFKQDWPEYVKAQKVHAHWETLLALEPRANPGTARVREIRREIARKFALAPDEVSRYISMVTLARDFEDYHVVARSKDPYAAKHRASERFQYFDELNKGKGAGGVNWSLNQDDSFKHLVFDILYDGKFKNWRQIRDLKYVYENEDAVEVLRKARERTDVESAQDDVDDAISIARMGRAEQRQTGANTKIRVFTEWFLGLPVKVFDPNEAGCVTQENLRRLRSTLKHVETYLEADDTAKV
ncbi:MAG: hypothetical protein OXU42_17665 [Deltaproteobacteria bacterium]|nr:hypothetical protein [Deltaproteobacteria bacterium]